VAFVRGAPVDALPVDDRSGALFRRFGALGRGRLKEESATATRAPARAGGLGLAVLLTLLVAMGPVSTDLYLPSLPGIARDLATGEGLAQLTIGLFIAGFAVMMLVCGSLADRFGRRPVLLCGMALYTLASIACALAADIAFLLAARFVQALGACVGPVIGRAIVRDLYEPREAGRILGYMASAMALAPLIGPFIGGYLEVAFGWRANFWALAAYGGALMAALALCLDETLRTPLSGALARMLGSYALILRNRAFLGFMLCAALCFGALFTWISNSAFVVIDHFGVAPERFGLVFGAVVLGYIAGAYGGSRAGMRFGLARATGIGAVVCAAAGGGLLVTGWSGVGGLPAITALSALSFFGAGMAIPQGTAGGLGPFPERAGSAAALLGFIQMMTGLLVNALSSLWFDGTPRPMVTLNAICALLALTAFWAFLRRA
jgi:DHA1 family bicyclomycin/chloramphenicol resistance-like MFS transporter